MDVASMLSSRLDCSLCGQGVLNNPWANFGISTQSMFPDALLLRCTRLAGRYRCLKELTLTFFSFVPQAIILSQKLLRLTACLICLTCRLLHIPFTETICWHLRFLKSNTVGQFHGQLAGFTRIGPITYNRVSPLSLLHAWRQSPARSTNWTRKLCLSVSLISWANIVCMFFLPFPVSV